MKIKNISGKIVSVGQTVILPNETKEVTGYDNSDALSFFVQRKLLRIVEDKTAAAPAAKKAAAVKEK